MAYFQKDPAKTMAADLAAKNAERVKLIARLTDAENAVVAATSAATELAVAGADDTALDRAEGKVTAARERLSTLRGALARIGETIVALENAFAEHKDKTTRRETARQCEKLADDIEQVGRDINPVLERLCAITSVAADAQIWDAAGLFAYADQSKSQIPAAIAAVSLALRGHGLRTMDGREARATLLVAPAPAATVLAIEPPPVERVFTLQHIKWTDGGVLMTASKFCDVDLPVETARRAIAARACAPTDSDVRRQWAGSRPMTHPPADECVSIDGADIVKLDAPAVDGQFVRVDRGPAYLAEIRKA
jgi:hypothetical protein